jgi:hypothetical protein
MQGDCCNVASKCWYEQRSIEAPQQKICRVEENFAKDVRHIEGEPGEQAQKLANDLDEQQQQE